MKSPTQLIRLFLLLASFAAMTGRANEWWGRSTNDAAWTNRSIAAVETAARSGDPIAQYFLARHRFVNAGRQEDWSESFVWVTRAAEAGLADAQFMAARFHMSGTATAENPVAGFNWAKKAEEQNQPDGIALLADAYASGRGTRRDPVKARELFERSIEAGSLFGLDWLGHFYLNGEGGTATRTNYAAALRCFERAASNGLAHAASHVIKMNRDGVGTPPNVERAVFWARTFMDQRDVASAEALAEFYAQGLAEPRHPKERPAILIRQIAEWRARALDRDDGATADLNAYFALTGPCRDLAFRYRHGVGTARDYLAAATWMLVAYRQDVTHDRNKDFRQAQSLHPFTDAARQTNSLSGEEGHWQEALRRVHRALEKSDATACREIGLAYRDGSALTPQDQILAHVWLTRAKELGDVQASAELAALEQKLTADELKAAKTRFLPRSER